MPQASQVTTASGRHFSVYRWGEGPPLLLIHGILVNSATWSAVGEALGQHFTCLAVDLPSHGTDTGSDDRALLSRPQELVHPLCELLDALQLPRVALLGHSYGGLVALHMLVRASERIETCAVIAPPALPYPTPMLAWTLKVPRFGESIVRRLYRRPLFERYFDHDVYNEQGRPESCDVDALYANFRRPERGRALTAGLRAALSPRLRDADISRMTKLRAVIWGAEDRIIPVDVGRRLAALAPRARLTVVPGACHALHELNAEAVATVLLPSLRN